ncbi:MAG: flagellar brake domain-containing protein [Lachnospiraceae bacterium]|nr:flagellar brake domain-containing protein [Lachnospiraceae bacterium]
MLNEYIRPGNVVEIVELQPLGRGSSPAKTYRTKIFDIVSEDLIKLIIPSDHGTLQLLDQDREYEMYFYTDNGLYQCMTFMKERYRTNNIPVMDMELVTNLRKYQRREYYRFSCSHPLRCRPLTEEESEDFMERGVLDAAIGERENALMADISGGGIRFISRDRYEVGSLLLFGFELNGEDREGDILNMKKQYRLVGHVIRSDLLENTGDQYETRTQYANIDNKDRESIIRYIFEQERKLRKTGK